MDLNVWPLPTLFLGNSGLGGDEKGDRGDPEVRGDHTAIPPPPPGHPSLLVPHVDVDQGRPCGLATKEVGGAGGVGDELRRTLLTDGCGKLANKAFALAVGGTPPDALYEVLEPIAKEKRHLTATDSFELAAAMGLLALMPEGSSKIAECAQELFERARETELPPSELLVLAVLAADEAMVNCLAKTALGRKDEHGYLLTYARGLHRARKRDFLGAAKIYSSMLEDEAAWTCPEVYEEAYAYFFVPIVDPQPEPMDESELAQAIQMVTPPPTL